MEQWKEIKGYESLYQISSSGRVKSLYRVDRLGRVYKDRILVPEITKKGYLRVSLGNRKDGFKKIMVHRLVAAALIRTICRKSITRTKTSRTITLIIWSGVITHIIKILALVIIELINIKINELLNLIDSVIKLQNMIV